MSNITGKTLIAWGLESGAWFKEAIPIAKQMRADGKTDREIIAHLFTMRATVVLEAGIPLRDAGLPFEAFIEPETEDEVANVASVMAHMTELMKVPTIVKGAVMPDACPSGSQMGTIPVGGVVAAKDAIHPGFHSADICCSVALSIFKTDMDVGRVMSAAMKATHFGPGGRPNDKEVPAAFTPILKNVIDMFKDNPFLAGLESLAVDHFMTQGDGNHFLYIGQIESSGRMALVTHHGSRGLGAQLYKRGMAAAERNRRKVAPSIPKHNAWIDAETDEGRAYFDALQIVRLWTKFNHFAIHHLINQYLDNEIVYQVWNEHNFVFKRADGLFYHAKGATPSYEGYAADDQGVTLIPLNMAQPILIAGYANNDDALGFAPHGAGRNLSRTAHMKRLAAEYGADDRGLSPRDKAIQMAKETPGLDVRFYTGAADPSEFPSAYKNADQVQAQINKHGLARILDRVLPRGSIMAGEMKWHRPKKAKVAQAA